MLSAALGRLIVRSHSPQTQTEMQFNTTAAQSIQHDNEPDCMHETTLMGMGLKPKCFDHARNNAPLASKE